VNKKFFYDCGEIQRNFTMVMVARFLHNFPKSLITINILVSVVSLFNFRLWKTKIVFF